MFLSSSQKQKPTQTEKTTFEGDDQDKVSIFYIKQNYKNRNINSSKYQPHILQICFDKQTSMNMIQASLKISKNFNILIKKSLPQSTVLTTVNFQINLTGLKEICRCLLKNQTLDLDQQTENNKQTALTVACRNGNYQIVRYLILAGAQVNKPNYLNQNPLTTILFRLVEQNYSFQNKKICLLIAELLIKHGADVNWVLDKGKGYSLIHYFCSSKMKMNNTQMTINFEIIKFLLAKGANQNQRTLKDHTCFDLIKNHCNKQKILQLLNEFQQKNAEKEKLKVFETTKMKKMTEQFMKIQFKSKMNFEDISTSKNQTLNSGEYKKQKTKSNTQNS